LAAARWLSERVLVAFERLYVRNVGDIFVSLAPVLAGLLVTASGRSIFDPLFAGGIAVWFIVSTLREVIGSHEEFDLARENQLWHSDHVDGDAVATPIADA
jgi:Co/Zn/Cd efflux system component